MGGIDGPAARPWAMGADDLRWALCRALHRTAIRDGHSGIYVRCALGVCDQSYRTRGNRRIYPIRDPGTLGVFYGGGRTSGRGNKSDIGVSCATAAGLAFLAAEPRTAMVDASTGPADNNRHSKPFALGVLMPDEKTIATYNAKAADYIKLVKTDGPDASLQGFMDLMPKGGTVLDLGCGPATSSAYMRDAGLIPDPVDAAQGMVDMANDTYNINARLGTFDDVTGDAIYAGVWANFSLLHAARTDLPRHMNAINTALVPGGILHIGMKTGDGAERDRIDRLYTYVTLPDLRDLLNASGFTVIYTKEGAEMGMAGTIDPFVIMRARKDKNA